MEILDCISALVDINKHALSTSPKLSLIVPLLHGFGQEAKLLVFIWEGGHVSVTLHVELTWNSQIR